MVRVGGRYVGVRLATGPVPLGAGFARVVNSNRTPLEMCTQKGYIVSWTAQRKPSEQNEKMKPDQGSRQSKCPTATNHNVTKGLTMLLEWDDEKRQQNIQKHCVDLLYAALIFEGPTLNKVDDRHDYGEERFVALGLVDGDPFTVVYTMRGENIRLISAWKGGRKDYEKYKDSFP